MPRSMFVFEIDSSSATMSNGSSSSGRAKRDAAYVSVKI
jgi:hypothetical protein